VTVFCSKNPELLRVSIPLELSLRKHPIFKTIRQTSISSHESLLFLNNIKYVLNVSLSTHSLHNPEIMFKYWCDSVGRGRAGYRADHDQQHCYHHAPTVKPEAATAVVEVLMMGVRTPVTCWAVNKRQVMKLEKLMHLVGWFIWIVYLICCQM